MKITKRQLRRIIKEALLEEADKWDNYDEYGNPKDGPKLYGPEAAAAGVGAAAQQMADKGKKGKDAPQASSPKDAVRKSIDIIKDVMGPRGDLPGGEGAAMSALMNLYNVLAPHSH